METYFFKSALCVVDSQPTDGSEANTDAPQWHNDVTISIDEGKIISVAAGTQPSATTNAPDGVAIPAVVNIHSHAFQRGFAGLSEFRTEANDSFWTWRKLMYDFVGKLTPDDVYVIARQLYLEMIAAGYSWVGEFHYLHNETKGNPYANPAAMAESVLRAAQETGIGICLLPVLYQRSGFDSTTTNESQKRFALTDDQYCELVASSKSKTDSMDGATVGISIHSLRAVGSEAIHRALDFREKVVPGCPVHIHVAEQTQEIDDCIAATGKRSVEYLFSKFDVDSKWCLIHATHMDDEETKQLAASGAIAGLCPTTEANLGDGFFPAANFLAQGGAISIGSDSHCSVDVADEIRTLEYGARLKSRQRAVLGTETSSVGRRLYQACAIGGGKAIGVATGKIATGYQADLLVIDDEHPTIAGVENDRLIDRFVFVNSGRPIKSRILNGKLIDSAWLDDAIRKSGREFTSVSRRLLR